MGSNIIYARAKRKLGFTLIEMILVLAVIASLMSLGVRYNQQQNANRIAQRIAAQMQQTLNASLAYYVGNGLWPTSIGTLVTANYLPSTINNNPNINGGYLVAAGPAVNGSAAMSMLYVWTQLSLSPSTTRDAIANTIAGMLPLAYTTQSAGTPPTTMTTCNGAGSCFIVTMVNIPGQNLNNATAVNFAGIYHNGACVPVPDCPVDQNGQGMTPEILVAPVSVSGIVSQDGTTANTYPISSFTTYGLGPGGWSSTPMCNGSPFTFCYATNGTTFTNGQFWRVCMNIATSAGAVKTSYPNNLYNADWGQKVSMMAITRCAISTEAINNSTRTSGSDFTVYQN